jgi:uncharacterized membrane protein YfcA
VSGPLPLHELWVAVVMTAVGAWLQGWVGFGFGFVAVPTLALLEPRALPATVLLVMFPVTIAMAYRERHAIDFRGALALSAGRVAGTALGVWLVVLVSAGSLELLLGATILVAVVMSVAFPAVDLGRGARLVAGFFSGVTGTTAGIGGPALALAYQGRPGPELRSTLAITFLLGQVLAVAGLAFAGRVAPWHGTLALQLVPAAVVGMWASHGTVRFLDERWLRPSILGFATVAGIVAVARSVL